MADQSHLDVLAQGVDVWNSWRKQNPTIVPSLAKSDLSGADLTEADLTQANLTAAHLYGTKLQEANFIIPSLAEGKARLLCH
jgi:uncharacterized protein YjbI with pentapeptide repeats